MIRVAARLSCALVATAPALALVACADEPSLPPEGAHFQYVVSDLRIPATNTEARMFSLDLNGDKTVDNDMGQIFAALNSMGLGVAGTADEALARGGLIMLADLQTTNFEDTASTGLTMYLGGEPSPAPCLDPADLATCGQHLQGSGQFSVADAPASDLAVAPIKNAVFTASMSRLPVEIVLDPTSPTRLDLHGAKVRWTAIAPDHASAILAGGITKADVDGVVIPEAASQLDRVVVEGCHPGTTVGECICNEGARGISLLTYFDDNDDCRISSAELAASNIARALLAPDITVGGEALTSFGVAVELVAATFAQP
jgi:hypothetical protein